MGLYARTGPSFWPQPRSDVHQTRRFTFLEERDACIGRDKLRGSSVLISGGAGGGWCLGYRHTSYYVHNESKQTRLNFKVRPMASEMGKEAFENLDPSLLFLLFLGDIFTNGIFPAPCAADIVRKFARGSPVIFPGRNYRWLMKMQLMMPRRLVATQVATSGSQDSPSGNQTRSLRPSPTSHVYAS